LSVKNEDYWKKCEECFSSLPVVDHGNEPAELWFTAEHDHDNKAMKVWDEANQVYMNELVSQDRKIADERGTKELIIDAAKYTGEDTMLINIIQ